MEAHKVREIENDKLFERKMVKEAEVLCFLYKHTRHNSSSLVTETDETH